MKNFFIISGLALSLAGCASGSGVALNSSKALGSSCATAGAALKALAIKGTPAQDALAMHYAAIITPLCSARTPGQAQSAAVLSALTALTSLAAPYMLQPPTATTGSPS